MGSESDTPEREISPLTGLLPFPSVFTASMTAFDAKQVKKASVLKKMLERPFPAVHTPAVDTDTIARAVFSTSLKSLKRSAQRSETTTTQKEDAADEEPWVKRMMEGRNPSPPSQSLLQDQRKPQKTNAVKHLSTIATVSDLWQHQLQKGKKFTPPLPPRLPSPDEGPATPDIFVPHYATHPVVMPQTYLPLHPMGLADTTDWRDYEGFRKKHLNKKNKVPKYADVDNPDNCTIQNNTGVDVKVYTVVQGNISPNSYVTVKKGTTKVLFMNAEEMLTFFGTQGEEIRCHGFSHFFVDKQHRHLKLDLKKND